MRRDSFDLNPLAPEERCTPLSVAAHTLYEKTRPDRLPGPGGVLVLDSAAYSQITEKTVRVSGAEFIPTPYQVKLEGVAHLGYRTVFVGGIRDPILISQIDDFLDRVRKYTQKLFPELDQSEGCRLIFHIYGRNGVMGPLEPRPIPSHEIAVVGEVVAPTQELSHTIANNARASILHFSYNDQMATTGNFASPFSPHEQEAGAVFKFTLYHLMNLEKDEEVSLFPVSFHHIASNRAPQPFQPMSEEEIRLHESGTLSPLMVEFKSEKLYVLDGKPAPSAWGAIGGLHATADGYVRIHDSFPNHRNGALRLLGLDSTATRSEVTRETKNWASIDLETVALQDKLVIYALRAYQQWDVFPQAKALSDFPIAIEKLSAAGTAGLPSRMGPGNDRSLRGLRVLELSRVIAAPLAGKTLAAHGADVLWVTSPTLPDLPAIDREFGRGKRTIQLDIRTPEDKERLFELIRTCDVLIQGFRPGSLAAQGLAPEQLVALNPNIVCANMSAFGPDGPWAGRRGFDSIVQTCSGMNVSEAEHYGQGEPARPTPCQALDHGAGYLLATGVCAALYRRAVEGGSYRVDVSLAGVMKYLRSLGQYEGRSGFDCADILSPDQVEKFLETRQSGFGTLKAVRHSAVIEGCAPGWDFMPKPLGSDKAEWLS
ncbi:Formyl-CoA:oxalate CoA-transferase [Lasiodiplodia hormozganensis]|uniref:Formyl-CoA:oxalate CoA-transferase n=1 Tax=Lasiodiplodia hormozganensis TaxID=869390 RepID=A0AA39Z338_9PEZI|nr:Formyl-CoA:oxalate CoA-transferase [Lasiodiplodia hormozganensis]